MKFSTIITLLAFTVGIQAYNMKIAAAYTVVEGDTCYNIARTHGMSLRGFHRLNPSLTDSCEIYPGQIVSIKTIQTTYTAIQGDCCNTVADSYSMRYTDFAILNPSLQASCTSLPLGSKVIVAATLKPYVVVDGDSCTSVKQAYGMSDEAYSNANPHLVGEITSGSTIFVISRAYQAAL